MGRLAVADPDSACGHAHLRGDFQQPQSDRSRLGLGPLGSTKSDAPQRVSVKQSTTRRRSPILRSAARNGSDPPSVVSRSPENSAATRRKKCASNSNCDWVHSVTEKAVLLAASTTLPKRSYVRESGLFLLQIMPICSFLVRNAG